MPQLVYGLLIVAALVWAERRKRIRQGIPLPNKPPLDVEQTYP